MGDVLEIVGAISPGLKLGWIVFAAWALAQAAWFMRARVPAPVAVKPARKRARNSSARRPSARTRGTRTAGDESNSQELLSSLGILQTPGASEYGVPMSGVGQSGPTVIA
jgi:hypothetical protein